MSNFVMGIDPGFSGGIAVYDPLTKTIVSVEDMPIFELETAEGKKRREIDAYTLASLIEMYAKNLSLVVIEEVGARPDQGVVSMFNFGKGVGTVVGSAAAFNLPIATVKPGLWKSVMGLSSDKNLSRIRASEFFPDSEKYFRRKKDDGRAEAALLAVFGHTFMQHLKWIHGAKPVTTLKS